MTTAEQPAGKKIARAQRAQPRRGLRRVEAAAYIGIGVTTFDKWVLEGRMPRPMRPSPGVVLWDVLELDAAFDALHERGAADQDAENSEWDAMLSR